MTEKSFHDSVASDRSEAGQEKYAYFHGDFVPLYEAKVSIMTHAFLFGTAVFEGIRGYYNPESKRVFLFRLREHYQRLKRNGRILKMDPPHSVEDLCRLTVELIRRNRHNEDCYVRPVLYKSALRIGFSLDRLNDFAMFSLSQGRYQAEDRPISVCISSWRRVEDNALPARAKINGAYVNSALAVTEAHDNGFDDAIFLNENGHVSEGTGMNLFMVRDGRLVTPPISENILEGITRDAVLQLVKGEMGLEVELRLIDRSELYTADELFFCGTGAEVLSIGSVDHRPVGEGADYPITRRLKSLYFDVVRGNQPAYGHWLTPVPPAGAGV